MKRLKVAIVHHHLRGGGVTRVIERSVQAMADHPVKVCVISGEVPPKESVLNDVNHGVIEGLSYGENNPELGGDELYHNLLKLAEELLGEEPDIWHIHNHSLGKNGSYTDAVVKLSEKGKKVFYQIHDFAEDNRPGNYKLLRDAWREDGSAILNKIYPTGEHIKYVVLNRRDQKVLYASGLSEESLKLLQNPVKIDGLNKSVNNASLPEEFEGKKLLVYPVRAIPRKNIGEILLWAALNKKQIHIGITLAPKNPVYKEQYDKWVRFSEDHSLPVTFEAGERWQLKFPELINLADGIITTSIAEGFGLVYLESWLAEKPLYGRSIPDIVSDFEKDGIQYKGMYNEILIPVSWLGDSKLRATFKKEIGRLLNSYGRDASDQILGEWYSLMIKEEKIDFGRLNPEMQQQVIEKLTENPELQKEIRASISAEISDEIIAGNKNITKEKYSLEKFGTDLYNIYQELNEAVVSKVDHIDPKKVLDSFLSPEYFSLLRE